MLSSQYVMMRFFFVVLIGWNQLIGKHVQGFDRIIYRDLLRQYREYQHQLEQKQDLLHQEFYNDLIFHNNDNNERIDDDDDYDDVEELYFTQRLDHYDPTNIQTYQQRYFTTSRYVINNNQDDGVKQVTFLCVGGEGPGFDKSVLVNSVHCTGDMLELAYRLKNTYNISVNVYALEHRYYGKSYPKFPNNESPLLTKNLKYLSSRQAQEDIAHFINSMKLQQQQQNQQKSDKKVSSDDNNSNNYNGIDMYFENNVWITFGGSYPGYMAGNARMKYPHLVYGAVSSSAPLQLKVDFPEYLERLGWDLRYTKIGGSQLCYNIVKNGHTQAIQMLQQSPEQLATMFNICNPKTTLHNRMNQNLLLGDGLINIDVQDNDPSCTKDLCNVEKLCLTITNMKHNGNDTISDLQILANISKLQQKQKHQEQKERLSKQYVKKINSINKDIDTAVATTINDDCIEVDWNATLEYFKDTTIYPGGTRSWIWQTCTEVGFYQTCKADCPYGSYYHLVEQELDICRIAYNISNVYDNVYSTIDHYGYGKNNILGGSRILTVHGDVDPWSTLGLLSSPKYTLPVQVVKGASHHFWTHEVKPTDDIEIVQVREYIYSVVMDWLHIVNNDDHQDNNKYYNNKDTTVTTTTTTTIATTNKHNDLKYEASNKHNKNTDSTISSSTSIHEVNHKMNNLKSSLSSLRGGQEVDQMTKKK